MIKKISLGIAFLCLASSASAQWEAAVGYSNLSLEWESFDLGAVVVGAGYNIPINERLTITPTMRLGYGVKHDELPWHIGTVETDENLMPVTYELMAEVKVRQYYGFQVRTQFELDSGVYLFAAPSYSLLEISMSLDTSGLDFDSRGRRIDEWGFGLGAGAGIKFSELIRAELSYERTVFDELSDTNMLNVQLRFVFK